jgi:hypothetical protein
VGGDAGEQRLGLVAPEQPPGQVLGREDRPHAELEERDRVAWRAQGEAQQVGEQVGPSLHQRADQASPPPPVAEAGGRLVHRAQQGGGPVPAEGVRGLDLRLQPLEPVALEAQAGEERRCLAEGVDG